MELLRNSRDAGAGSVYVASVLRRRRYRTLTVIDDGEGLDNRYAEMIFEPGVTSRHLSPTLDASDPGSTHGAGLSLYHIRTLALSAACVSSSHPTSFSATFDTTSLPERVLQSPSRASRSNLLATTEDFANSPQAPTVYYGSPSTILATLLKYRIIQANESAAGIAEEARRLGLAVSLRTVHRIKRGEVEAEASVGRSRDARERWSVGVGGGGSTGGGEILSLGEEEMARIAAILGEAARASYLEVRDLRQHSRPGEIRLSARVEEPEDLYEQ